MKVWHIADKVEKLMFTLTLNTELGTILTTQCNAMCERSSNSWGPKSQVWSGPNDAGRKYNNWKKLDGSCGIPPLWSLMGRITAVAFDNKKYTF